jgi:hypothetical protein
MHTMLQAIAVTFLTLGTLSFAGCQNIQPTTTPGESGFAGGDGGFGEDPSSPGTYRNFAHPTPVIASGSSTDVQSVKTAAR